MNSHSWINGVVVRGHQVASGNNPNSPYPKGSVEMQLPFFKSLGLDLTQCYPATLNVQLAINTFSIIKPDYCFPKVNWTSLIPPETFSFVACKLCFEGKEYDTWLYYPRPETKPEHFQPVNVVEMITKYIPTIEYGKSVAVAFNKEKVNTIF